MTATAHTLRTPNPDHPHRYTHRIVVSPAPGIAGESWTELRLNTPAQWDIELTRHIGAVVRAEQTGECTHHHRAVVDWLTAHHPTPTRAIEQE